MDENTGWSPELGVLQVASPCPARWDQMKGDARVRFCAGCKLNVYDLSAMGAEDARTLLLAREGRLCVRFFRRADGRVLTADCPRGVAARVRRRFFGALATVLALLGVSRLPLQFAEPEASGPPPPMPIPHAAQKPGAQPPDEKWMQQRREQTGQRSYPVMGVIRRQIEVIKADPGKKI